LLRDGYRDEGHFISVMCLYADIDNDDPRNEESMAYWDDLSNQMPIPLIPPGDSGVFRHPVPV